MSEFTEIIERPAWMRQAACAEMDTDLFFPKRGGVTAPIKRICAKCPVRAQCLAYAMSNGERHGIWGGFSESERRKIRSQRGGIRRNPATCGTPGGYVAHRRRHEAACDPCKEAIAAYRRNRRIRAVRS